MKEFWSFEIYRDNEWWLDSHGYESESEAEQFAQIAIKKDKEKRKPNESVYELRTFQ